MSTTAGAGRGPGSPATTLVDEPGTRPADGADPRPPDDVRPRWPLWASHGVLPVGLVAAFLVVAGIDRLIGWPGVAVALVVAVVAVRRCTRRAPAAVAGVLAWAGLSAGLGLIVVAAAGGARRDLTGVASGFVVLAVTGVVTLVSWRPAGRPADAGVALAGRVRALADAAFAPPRAWAAWIVGAGLGAPLVALYAPIILDVDSAWVVMADQGVQDHGVRFLQETQDVALPQVVLGPILRLWGYQGAIGFSIATVAALAALVSVVAYRLTRRPVASFVAGGALLAMPSIVPGAYRLPMYATMLFLGYLGAVLLHGAMDRWPQRWWWALVGGLALGLAPEAHSLGQLFYLVPFLLLILRRDRAAVRAVLVGLAAMVVTSIPRIWINLSIGGLHRFRSNRTDWLVDHGYLRMINERLRNQRSNDGPLAYLGNVPHLLLDAFGVALLVLVVALIGVAAATAARRTALFGVAVVAAFVVALVVTAPGTYGRYLTPVGVGAAIVAGCGAAALDGGRLLARDRPGRRWGPGLAAGGVALVMVLATVQIGTNVRRHQADVRRLSPSLTELSDTVPPDEGVMGVRSNLMVYVDPNLRTLYGRTMSERDFVTYLTWPSDQAVIRMMRRLGVSWVVVRDSKFAETTYHETWLRPVYGERDRHAHQIHVSSRFCRVAHVNRTVLYRIGHCPDKE